MRRIKFLLVLVLLALTMSISPISVIAQKSPPPSPPQPMGFWATITAYKVAVAYWIGIEPHYAAFFNGSATWAGNQHYLGPGGDAATCGSSSGCISNWDWWGSPATRLLVPKGGWLWEEPPWGPRWQGSNYQADCYFP